LPSDVLPYTQYSPGPCARRAQMLADRFKFWAAACSDLNRVYSFQGTGSLVAQGEVGQNRITQPPAPITRLAPRADRGPDAIAADTTEKEGADSDCDG